MAKEYRTTPEQIDHMPSGVPYIIVNEAAERFSFYGMKAILIIFMTRYLVDASGAKAVMDDETAKYWLHLFVAACYFFPVVGAILSDAIFGKYRTIFWLSMLYCVGHAALAINETWVGLAVGLTFIALGSGGIKPCVSANVGDQFGSKNKHLLSKVFSWFYFAINLGAFASMLLTPLLLDNFGPWAAFGLPGILMAFATFIFWLGRHKYVHIPPGGMASVREAFSGDGLRAIGNLVPLYLCIAVFWSVFDQTGSAWIIQATQMNRTFLGITWLPSQIQAVNSLLVLVFIPLFSYVIYPTVDRFWTMTPLRKICTGFVIVIIAWTLPALIDGWITGGRVYKCSSEADIKATSSEQLLDGKTEGIGWLSAGKDELVKSKQEQFPQEIVLRLRERQAWPVSGIQLKQAEGADKYFAKLEEEGKSLTPEQASEMAEQSRAKEVVVFVGDAPKPKEWKKVTTITFAPGEMVAAVQLPETIDTEYVKFAINSNFGGEYVGLGEIEVLSEGTAPPANADNSAGQVWPNVAAYGFQPSIGWQIFAYVLLTVAEVMISITGLEFSYSQSPKKVKSFIMSLWLLSVAVGNIFTSVVNGYIANENGTSKLDGPAYYWFFGAVLIVATLACMLLAKFYTGKTYIQGEDEDGPDDGGTDNVENEKE